MLNVRHGVAPAGDGSALFWAQAGAGADIVLVHGAVTTLADMALALFPALEGLGRLTAFDRPGHGRSETGGWTGSPWRQAAAIRDAARTLGLRRPVVVGHSFGAAVAVAHALLYPAETRGVVAIGPIAFPEARLEHVLFAPRGLPPNGRLLNRMLAATADEALLPILWNAMFLPQTMPADYAARFEFSVARRAGQMAAEGEDALSINGGLARSLLAYGRCPVPIEVMIGGADMVVNPWHGRLLARLLPRGRLTELPGMGHMLHHFAPGLVAEAVAGLLAEESPSPNARRPSAALGDGVRRRRVPEAFVSHAGA